MRIFVYEHATCAAGGEPALEPLVAEGRAMLEALAEDIGRLPGVTVARMDGGREDGRTFDDLARASDGVVLIAPELDGCLAGLARRVLAAGGRLLGPAPDAIDEASDKLLLPRRLRERGVPCIDAAPLPLDLSAELAFPAVVKPRRGAGSIGVRLARGPCDLRGAGEGFIATPYVDGLPASVLCCVGPRGILPLRAGEQILSTDGAFRYEGGRIPLPPRLEARARKLALRAINAVPGLLGFTGVDVVLASSSADGSGDRVVEVNARLTTSYLGLRALARTNLAEHWLRVVHGEHPAQPEWEDGCVELRPDGRVTLLGPTAA